MIWFRIRFSVYTCTCKCILQILRKKSQLLIWISLCCWHRGTSDEDFHNDSINLEGLLPLVVSINVAWYVLCWFHILISYLKLYMPIHNFFCDLWNMKWKNDNPHCVTYHAAWYKFIHRIIWQSVLIAGTLGCVFIDNETHESGVTKCKTGEAWSAFSWHHSSVFHCQWTHNQVFLLFSHMLI